MTLEIRRLKDEEVEAAELISMRAFGAPMRFDMPAHMQRIREEYTGDDYLGVLEDGEVTSIVRILPSAMKINGASLGFGVVSPVASSGLHRRKGHAGAMLRQSLSEMRDRRQIISGLYTPHPALYRRYGWEICGDARLYNFAPKDLRLTVQPSQRGRLRYVEMERWRELDAVYRRHGRQANGPLDRDEAWWRRWVLRNWQGRIEGMIWQSQDGVDEGYVLYMDQLPRPGEMNGHIVVTEMVSTSSDAYLNLLTAIAQNDIRLSIELHLPSDDPLPLLFEDAERLEMHQHYSVLLRLVDVAEALRQRPVVDTTLDTQLSIEVSDRSAPWNNGTWLLRVSEGRCTVEATTGPGELSIDAQHLAPVFNGYVSPRRAATSGLLRAASEDALSRAEAIFATHERPFFPDHY
jgi:predicted acetyltransferase